jgi:hypothetical protein
MQDVVEKMQSIKGFVVAQESTVSMSMMGDSSVSSTEETKTIEQTDVPEGTYDVPTGYSRAEFDYMKMMQ